MMKKEILLLAENSGIKKCGFSENSFVALFPYYVGNECGNVSQYARGVDYHRIVEERLRPIAEKIKELGGVGKIHVDNGELNDRRAAYQAGLGFYGMNGMLICEEYGTYFFIGQVVHNLDIEADAPIKRECFKCGKCIESCTGGALSENGFNIERCVSHISQKKGELSAEEEALILKGGMCWGCDVCQEVCPHNARLENTALDGFYEKRICELKSEDLEGLSNREFKEKYGDYAFSWRGRGVLIRNLNLLARKEREDAEE